MKYEIEIEGLPYGWKPVAFRAPKKDELYYSDGVIVDANEDLSGSIKRMIVERIKPRRIVLEDTGEFRKAKKDEGIEDSDREFQRWNFKGNSSGEYKIWREVNEDE